ncbi:MAG: hypothetical protein RH860_00010 [Cytophagales bacterium]
MSNETENTFSELDIAPALLKKIHKTGLKGIVFNYVFKKDWIILSISILLSGLLTYISYMIGDLEEILRTVLEMLFTTIPTILGFLVAGFALMFGFGDSSFLIRSSKLNKNYTSFYLSNVRSFSFALFAMIVSLLLMFIFQVLIEIPSPFPIKVQEMGVAFLLFVLLFFGFYSILLLYHAIKNVFNLTITHHWHLFHRRNPSYKNIHKEKNQ